MVCLKPAEWQASFSCTRMVFSDKMMDPQPDSRARTRCSQSKVDTPSHGTFVPTQTHQLKSCRERGTSWGMFPKNAPGGAKRTAPGAFAFHRFLRAEGMPIRFAVQPCRSHSDS